MKAPLRTVLSAVVASHLLAPTAFTQPKPAGAKTVDPCALLVKAEIADVLGVKVSDAKLNSINAAGPQCEFKLGDYGVLNVFVRHGNPNDKPDVMIAELQKRKITTAELTGVGDRSFYASPGYGMVQLNTFKGTAYLLITALVPGAPEAKVKAGIEKLMAKALTRL